MACSTIPVIAAGGSGNYEHLKAVFLETDASAVACGSLFNFSDSNPIRAKAFLSNYGVNFKVV
jgi:cyclase